MSAKFRPDLRIRLSKELAVNNGDDREDRLTEFAEVRGVLDERIGVLEPLEDDALGLVVVEVDVVLQGSGVLRPHDLPGFGREALELVELAVMDPEPSDA